MKLFPRSLAAGGFGPRFEAIRTRLSSVIAFEDPGRRSAFTPFVFIATIVGFVAAITWRGVPVVRHDWHWPTSSAGFLDWLISGSSAWRPEGIGHPSPFPTEYFFGTIASVFGLGIGARAGLIVFSALVAAAITSGAYLTARRLRCGPLATSCLAIIALLNPWVYNEIVAGHLMMLIGYAGLLFLAAELVTVADEGSEARVAVAIVLVCAQLQFIVVGVLPLAYLMIRVRSWRLPILAAALVAPYSVGIVANLGDVLATPYQLVWEMSQSPRAIDAVVLSGYFTGYASAFVGAIGWALWAVVAVAAVGALQDRRAHFAAIAVVAVIIFISAPHGPLAAPFALIVERIPASGIFRELYDLVALVAVGYIVLCAIATARFPLLSLVLLPVALSFVFGWSGNGLWKYFVPGSSVPEITVNVAPNHRFALLPSFQPFSFDGLGAGLDPQSFSRPGNRGVLNEYIPEFPEDAALAHFAQTGDTKPLLSLSVMQLIDRHGFASITNVLNPMTSSSGHNRVISGKNVQAWPELYSSDRPPVVILGNDITRPAITALADIQAIVPHAGVAISADWVDARFGFLEFPAIAEAFPATATSSNRTLSISGLHWLFGFVAGALVDERGKLLNKIAGWQWMEIESTERVRCFGVCSLVGTRRSPINLRLNASSESPRLALNFSRPLPWLVIAKVPKTAAVFLTYRERYDRAWLAWIPGLGILNHSNVNGVFNGWDIPARAAGERIILVDFVAAIQAVLVLMGLAIGITALSLGAFKIARSAR